MGNTLTFNSEGNDLWQVNIDKDTIIKDTAGVLSVDKTKLSSVITDNLPAGNLIATHTSADGTVVAVYETITLFSQNTSTGVISYENENGDTVLANVVSTDALQLLTVGTDGGALLKATDLISTDTGNDLTVGTDDKLLLITKVVSGAVWDDSSNTIVITFDDGSTINVPIVDSISNFITSHDFTDGTTTFSLDNSGVVTFVQGNGATVSIDASGNVNIAARLSTDALNLLKFGTDGGLMLDSTDIVALATEEVQDCAGNPIFNAFPV